MNKFLRSHYLITLVGITSGSIPLVSMAKSAALPIAPPAPLIQAATGHYVSLVKVDGKGPYEFVIDTGAEGCAVYQDFARQHAFESAGTEKLLGQTGASTLNLVSINRIETAGITTGPLSCVVLPSRKDGGNLNGIIGLDSMGQHAVYFNPSGQQLAFYATKTEPSEVLGASFVTIKGQNRGNTLLTFPISINGAMGIAVLDSGARRSIINDHFAAAAAIDVTKLTEDVPLFGAAGIKQVLLRGTLGTVEIGGRSYADVQGAVADLPIFAAFGVENEPAMILGLDFLASGAMLVDFPAMNIFIARP
jgi:predicted aspartyl protease